jgi:hypothetical protein
MTTLISKKKYYILIEDKPRLENKRLYSMFELYNLTNYATTTYYDTIILRLTIKSII